MDRSEVINLVTEVHTQDENGVFQTEESKRQVFCSVNSVRQNEFFQGGAAGLKPVYRFDVFRYDYNDEEIVEYKGQRYNVYRTYVAKDEIIELHCQKDIGA